MSNFNLISNLDSCYVTVPHLTYYSHIPTALIALLLGFFVYFKNKKENTLSSKILLLTALSFFTWSALDLSLWLSVDSRIIMSSWMIINLFEMLASSSTLYFSYVFLEKKDVPILYKFIVGGLLMIFILLINSNLNLSGFITSTCEASQGILKYYFYFFEILIYSWLTIYLARKIFSSTAGNERKMTIYFSIGAILFLSSFSGVNIVASLTEKWQILQYGLFGMPVFMGFLVYLIVKYKAFNIKLVGAQAIVVSLIILIASQFAFVQNPINKVLNGFALAFIVIFGWSLVRSVKKEVAQKEELEIVNAELVKLDQAKSEFISIASHQLRTPLTVIKGYISMLMDGNFGAITPVINESLGKVYLSNQRLINLVEDLLNISRIESGRLQITLKNEQLEDLVASVCDELEHSAEKKGLKFEFVAPKTKLPPVSMDEEKMRQVVMNLIDNSIKYTPKGSVTVSLKLQADSILFCVSDSGLGVSAEDMPNLFKKFSRGTGMSLIHTEGTGLGLYVVKQIVEIHGGRTWIESAGEFKGSKFYFEIPFIKEINKLS